MRLFGGQVRGSAGPSEGDVQSQGLTIILRLCSKQALLKGGGVAKAFVIKR